MRVTCLRGQELGPLSGASGEYWGGRFPELRAYLPFSDDWPHNGELDIVEGVNDSDENLTSLHTTPNCTQPKTGRKMTGAVGYYDCNVKGARGNKGCGVSSNSNKSFGPNFNKNGGGWYATERTESSIKVWFFARDDSNAPDDVREHTGSVNPDNWGQPTALFVTDSCDLSQKFGPNKFVSQSTERLWFPALTHVPCPRSST